MTTRRKSSKEKIKKLKKKINKKEITTLRLLVRNDKLYGGIESVRLYLKYRLQFIENFGLESIPDKKDFNIWLNNL